ncbi:Enoyl-CoA hydratase / Enoyl-CoA hydratase [valine degradation] / 3-hydroxyacyl-CoA dehydrogenase [Staphylococcus aureus]|uniref:Enoyl-CoA hydratase / Enoyl-CoA hydratase [valine degradation] / 3-hydroxyacyl-CoA dehydrogenase n=1 Tax=Staphylococcus aureus TaxID=1280 RepID=A0A380EDW3_STAAU|nr:Enoyl-CoA hydratase / Enoyl-CoA hydratase [valine degradation] / 3-hydroxyacyl-CoA dehydrogenase [Staphylococcus aureus]
MVNDDADLYIEAVKEDIEIKHAVWQQVLQHAKEDALFATNTSGIPINAMLKHLTRRIKNDSLVYISLTHHVL